VTRVYSVEMCADGLFTWSLYSAGFGFVLSEGLSFNVAYLLLMVTICGLCLLIACFWFHWLLRMFLGFDPEVHHRARAEP
jgi:hypothetical protein